MRRRCKDFSSAILCKELRITFTYLWYYFSIFVILLSHICGITFPYLWYYFPIFVILLSHICDITFPYLWYYFPIFVVLLSHICGNTFPYLCILKQHRDKDNESLVIISGGILSASQNPFLYGVSMKIKIYLYVARPQDSMSEYLRPLEENVIYEKGRTSSQRRSPVKV